jgi:ribosomal protein S18 acetylase RimI-like enzyme
MTTESSVRIRVARLPDDKPAILGFIMGLQRFEKAIEPDRRIDPAVADEFYAVITERVARRNGCMLIAESANGKALGWAVAYESNNEIYVHADERTYGYIAELYVIEEARRQGIGGALIGACESWAKGRALKVMIIGALTRNEAAFAAYRSAGFTDYATELRKYLR